MDENIKIKDLPQEQQDILIKKGQELELKGNLFEYKLSTLLGKIAKAEQELKTPLNDELLLEIPEIIESYMWLQPKPNDLKVKITGIHPGGADPFYPESRYKVNIIGLGELVMSKEFIRALFGFTGIIGTHQETFEQSVERLSNQESEG